MPYAGTRQDYDFTLKRQKKKKSALSSVMGVRRDSGGGVGGAGTALTSSEGFISSYRQ